MYGLLFYIGLPPEDVSVHGLCFEKRIGLVIMDLLYVLFT